MTSSSILYTVHTLLQRAITPGDVVIDATAGNGRDTVFLAGCVGPTGTVYAFDIQEPALQATAIATSNLAARVRLVHAGHHAMLDHVDPTDVGDVAAVVFNLGYLPGGDKAIMTTSETTIAGVEQALTILRPDGMLVVVCYKHDHGQREYEALREVLQSIPQRQASVLEYNFINQMGNPPMAFVVSKQPLQKERQ